MADFTWALATLLVQSMPCRAPPLDPQRGQAALARTPRPSAPICSSGSATRSMGRRESEASPVNSVSQSNPATNPASSRMEVPEFPQSSGSGRLVQATAAPVDAPRCRRPPFDPDPHGLDRGQGARHVSPVGEPVDHRGALGQGAEQDGPVRDRLLPGRADRAPAGHAAVARPGCAGRRHESCSARQR